MIRFFILACVAIALIQQKTDDNHVGNKGQKNANAAQSNASAPAPSHPPANATDQKPTGDADKRQNNEVQVAIPRKITVEPVKDYIDKVILGCTILLTGVGIIGTCAAIKTLNAINVQAHWMKVHARHLDKVSKAAEANAVAAKKSAEALIEGQRPTIAAAIVGNPTKDLHDRDAPRIKMSITNKGVTTAYELTYQSWIELLPFPFIDFTEEADHFASENPYSLYPNNDPVAINIPIRKGLTEAQLKDLRELKVYACVRVRVAFRDAFSNSRYSNFGLYVMREGAGFLPKYNDSN